MWLGQSCGGCHRMFYVRDDQGKTECVCILLGFKTWKYSVLYLFSFSALKELFIIFMHLGLSCYFCVALLCVSYVICVCTYCVMLSFEWVTIEI